MLAALDARMIAHSGIGTHTRGLLAGFAGLGRTDDILLLGERAKIDAAGFGGFAVHEFAAPVYSLREQLCFPRAALRRRGIGVVHVPHYNVPYAAPGLRLLATIHDAIHLTHAPGLQRLKRIYARQMLQRAWRRADRIATVSGHSESELRRLFGARPRGRDDAILLTPNAPADDFRRAVAPEEIAAARAELGLTPLTQSGGEPYLLTVGIHKPHKNFAFLVRVVAGMWVAKQLRHTLVMVGIPPEEADDLRAIARAAVGADEAARRLLIPGRLDWRLLPPLYAGAAALVMPSLAEGFGLPVVEAQAVGTPVACSRAASLPEVAGAEGAVFFDPTDAADAARALIAATGDDDLRTRLVASGRANAERYSWRATAETLLGAYTELASSSQPSP